MALKPELWVIWRKTQITCYFRTGPSLVVVSSSINRLRSFTIKQSTWPIGWRQKGPNQKLSLAGIRLLCCMNQRPGYNYTITIKYPVKPGMESNLSREIKILSVNGTPMFILLTQLLGCSNEDP